MHGAKAILGFGAWRLAGLLLVASLSTLPAAPPGWWLEEDTRVLSEEAAPNDFGPVNLGQLKHTAKQAKKHLDAFLPSGAGPAIDTLVSEFEPRSGVSYTSMQLQTIRAANHAPANLGQLKAVAKPFYDRLLAEGYDTKANLITRGYPTNWQYDYPWNPQSPKTINYSPANLGQLKMVFSFDLGEFQPLQAIAQEVSTSQDTALSIYLGATGGGNNSPSYSLVSVPQDGSAVLNGNIVWYFPSAHFHGVDSFRFRVTEGLRSSEANVQITVGFVNQPPLVYVGGGRNVVLPEGLTLFAAVTDIDTPAQDLLVNWAKVSGPGDVAFGTPNSLSTTASFTTEGEYVLRLSANDGTSTRSDSLVVIVSAETAMAPPTVSISAPTNDSSFEFAQPIGFGATATAGAGATITKVEFYEGSRKIAQVTTPTGGVYSTNWEAPRLGIFAISAVATDSNGLRNFSAPVVVRVTQEGWFANSGLGGGASASVNTAGNEGYSGSGGDGGIGIGSQTGPGGNYGPGTGANGGGSSAGGGGDGLGNPRDADPYTLDADEDGVSDGEEKERGTNILIADTDHDGASDLVDGWPLDPKLSPPRLPEISHFALIPLRQNGYIVALNDIGDVLLTSSEGYQVWQKGTLQTLNSPTEGHSSWSALSNDGRAYGFQSAGGKIVSTLSWINGQTTPVAITPYTPAEMASVDESIVHASPVNWMTSSGTFYLPTFAWGLQYIGTETYGGGENEIVLDKFKEFEYSGMVAYSASGLVTPLPSDVLVTKTDKIYTRVEEEGTSADLIVDEDVQPLVGITMTNPTFASGQSIYLANDRGVLFGIASSFAFERIPFYPDTGITPNTPWHIVSMQSDEPDLAIYWNGRYLPWPQDHIPVCITNNDSPYFIRDNDDYDNDYKDEYRALKIWRLTPDMQLSEVYSTFSAPSRLVGVANNANSKLQIIGWFNQLQTGHETSGEIIHNGRVISVGGDWGGWHISEYSKINENGLITVIANRDENGDGVFDASTNGPDKRYAALLAPVHLQTESLPGGRISEIEGPVAQSDPRPQVELKLEDAHLDAAGNLIIRIRGKVEDRLSEVVNQTDQRVSSVHFTANGKALGTKTLEYGAGRPPFTVAKSTTSFDETFTISNPQPGSYEIKAETDENAAGNAGWDRVAVGLALEADWQSSNASQIAISLPQGVNSSTTDSATISISGTSGGQVTLAETATNTCVFSGSLGQGSSVTLAIRGPIELSAESVDVFDVELHLSASGSPDRVVTGAWKETGANSRSFEADGFSIGSERLVVRSMPKLHGSQKETFEPLMLKVDVPEQWLETEGFSVKVNGVEHSLKKFTFDNKDGLYLTSGTTASVPKVFIPSSKALPSEHQLPEADPESGEVRWSMTLGETETTLYSLAVVTGHEPDVDARAAARSAQGWQPGDLITEDDVITAFNFIYPDEVSQLLLRTYQETGQLIILQHQSEDYKFEYLLRTDGKFAIKIRDNNPEMHPGIAAQYLWMGLNRALTSYTFRRDAQDRSPNLLLTAQILQTWHEQAATAACEVGVAAAELYLAGISIVNEGADWALVLNDLAEGNYSALAAALPFVPHAVVSGGKLLKIRKASGEILAEFNNVEKLAACRQLSFNSSDLRTMGVTMEREKFEHFLREVLSSHGGPIRVPTDHQDLKKRMLKAGPKPNWGKKPPKLCDDGKYRNYDIAQAHHDFPWFLKKWFADHGLDVNNPAFGRWASEADHYTWHNEMIPNFNDFWSDFRNAELLNNPYSAEEILQKLRDARSQFPVLGTTHNP